MDCTHWKDSTSRERSVEGIGLLANESRHVLEAHPSTLAVTNPPGQSKVKTNDMPLTDLVSIEGWPPNPNKGYKMSAWLRVLAFITNIAIAFLPLLFLG